MNILVCDLCRKEIEGDPMSVQFGAKRTDAEMIAPTRQPIFTITDVCGICMDSITSFLDGLKVGPPGASLMLPKEEKKKETKK